MCSVSISYRCTGDEEDACIITFMALQSNNFFQKNFFSSPAIHDDAGDAAALSVDGKMDSFYVSGQDVTGSSKAISAIGATAEAWLRQINWVNTAIPLDLVFKYKASNKRG